VQTVQDIHTIAEKQEKKNDLSSLRLFPLFDGDLYGTTYGSTMTGIYVKPQQWYTKILHSANMYTPLPHAATATGLLLFLILLIVAKLQEERVGILQPLSAI
jgi:hypothetical protein